MIETTAAIFQTVGMDHRLNEDRYRLLGGEVPLVRDAGRGHLYGVMDGVGSAPLGMKAAQHIADRLVDFYRDPSIPATPEGIAELLHAVDREVREFGLIHNSDTSLGAAAGTVVWFSPERECWVFHCGDTAAFCCDGRQSRQLTQTHGRGRLLKRYFGRGEPDELVVERFTVEEGDTICLVSDGVTKSMNPTQVNEVLIGFGALKWKATELATRARARGSRDDITVVLIELDGW